MESNQAAAPPRKPGNKSQPQVVFLVGFMGAGKTRVGATLAGQLGYRFIDLDERIEARQKRRIAEIFRDGGEDEFRRAESAELKRVVEELAGSGAAVVALGGGAFMSPDNGELLRRCRGCSVFLEAPVDELWQRTRAEQNERPLAFSENQFRQLYAARHGRYMEADYHIQTSGRTVEEVAQEIQKQLRLGERR